MSAHRTYVEVGKVLPLQTSSSPAALFHTHFFVAERTENERGKKGRVERGHPPLAPGTTGSVGLFRGAAPPCLALTDDDDATLPPTSPLPSFPPDDRRVAWYNLPPKGRNELWCSLPKLLGFARMRGGGKGEQNMEAAPSLVDFKKTFVKCGQRTRNKEGEKGEKEKKATSLGKKRGGRGDMQTSLALPPAVRLLLLRWRDPSIVGPFRGSRRKRRRRDSISFCAAQSYAGRTEEDDGDEGEAATLPAGGGKTRRDKRDVSYRSIPPSQGLPSSPFPFPPFFSKEKASHAYSNVRARSTDTASV